MTIKELIRELENFDGDMEVVTKQSNGVCVEAVSGADTKELRSFYGKDRTVVVIMPDGQIGAI
jgi:hypothetical protein